MKTHIALPLILVAAAIIIGAATIIVNERAPQVAQIEQPTVSPQGGATIVAVSLAADNTAAAGQTGARVISWQTANFPSNFQVTINLIKKVSDNPLSYEFVRTLAENTANDGSEPWVVSADEVGDAYYIEVVCGSTYAQSCTTSAAPVRAF
jgi:hypothetical protein